MPNAITAATALVSALGADWELMPNQDNDNYQAFKNKKTGAEFFMSTQKCDGKVKAGVHIPNEWYRNGSWPTVRDERGNSVERPSIKMNPDKSADKMADDFRKRLELDGIFFFLASKAALNAEENAAKNRLDNRKNIAKALGAEWTPYFAEHDITTTVNKVHVSANVTVSNNVELTLSYLTVEQAQTVIALLSVMKSSGTV